METNGLITEQTTTQPSGRFETASVATVAGAHAVHDSYQAFLATLLPVLIERFSITTAEAGIFSFINQALSLFQPLFGHLADRINLRWLVFLAPALTGIAASLLGVAPVYIAAALLCVVTGLSSAGFHAVAPVIAANYSGARIGRGMSFWMVGGELGRTLGPLLVVGWIALAGVGSLPWLMLPGLLVAGLLSVRLRHAPLRAPGAGQSFPLRQALRRLKPMLVPMSAILLLRALMESALATFIPTLVTQDGAELWLAGVSFAVFEVAGVLGALTGGSLSDRLGRRRLLFSGMALAPLALLLFLSLRDWLALPALALVGLLSLGTNPVVMAVFAESLPENRALANGLYMAVHLVLRALATLAIGVMGNAAGLRYAFAISAWVALVAVPLVLLLPGKTKQ